MTVTWQVPDYYAAVAAELGLTRREAKLFCIGISFGMDPVDIFPDRPEVTELLMFRVQRPMVEGDL